MQSTRKSEWIYYESAGGWKTASAAEKGERTAMENEAVRTASGARIDTGETMFAVRQRYRGQSGVEQLFALRAFSLLHASQHAFTGAFDAGLTTREDRPVNMKSTTTRSPTLIAVKYALCIAQIILTKKKKQ